MFPEVLQYILFSFMFESNKSYKADITWVIIGITGKMNNNYVNNNHGYTLWLKEGPHCKFFLA